MGHISRFVGAKPYKITKPIRLVELFGGIGSQAKALFNLGKNFEHYRMCDFDRFAVDSYNAVHGTNFVPSDITKLKAADLGIVDTDLFDYIWTYSFPCFTGDSLVLTCNGYKNIKDIIQGDRVLTHTNSYKEVVNVFDNGRREIYSIKAMAVDEIKSTYNHKFYVREMYRQGHKQVRLFKEPDWKELKDITKKDYLGVAINQESIIPKWDGIEFKWTDNRKSRYKNELSQYMNNADFWWIIGRYIGDGWIRNQGGIIVSCNKKEINDITLKLDNIFNYSIVKEKTVVKIHIPLKELELFVSQFGSGAKNKKLTATIFDLPITLLKGFIDGYISADGCLTQGVYKASSVSRELIYGMAQCVAKAYKTPYRVYKTKRNKTCIIEGRTVNQNDTYELVFKKDIRTQDKAFYENGYIWFPIKSIDYVGCENVYDIEVEKDHSYTVQNTIVHNCQDLSVAGAGSGMSKGSGTRSGLLWEVERLLSELDELPQILLMENVPQVVGKKHLRDFEQWQIFLDSLGYRSFGAVLNATGFGVPQNRERAFLVSVRGNYFYTFPRPFPLTLRLRDMLEDEVDAKYYLSDELISRFLYKDSGRALHDSDDGVIGTVYSNASERFRRGPLLGGVCNTLKANSSDVAVILDTEALKIREATKKGYVEAYAGDGVTLSYPSSNERRGRVFREGTQTILPSSNANGVVVEPPNGSIHVVGDLGFKYKSSGVVLGEDGVCSALTTMGGGNTEPKVLRGLKIRKLTPRECWRLMGFTDEDFDKAQLVNSNTQLYKQAGNSIVVNVLEAIFKQFFD